MTQPLRDSKITLPPGACLPDYAGGSIVNLMASIMAAHDVPSSALQSTLLPASKLGKKQVLLVIDGLGLHHLKEKASGGFLNAHCLGSLTSVVPSATAAAIPVYLTGEPPARHGFTGWFSWYRELSSVCAILPFVTRTGYLSLASGAITPKLLSAVDAISTKLGVPCWQVAPKKIAFSRFSTDFKGTSSVLAYETFDQLIDQTAQAVSELSDEGYVYVYWSEYDHITHRYGLNSRESDQHLAFLDNKVRVLAEKLSGENVDLIVCADHGFTDCPDENQYVLSNDFPQLAKMLQMPLTGEPRLAIAHLKNGLREDFLYTAQQQLQNIATVVGSEDFVHAGFLGPGENHPELLNRLGDVLLLMHEHTVMFDPLPGEKMPQLRGHHGGLSQEEMQVPLIYTHC